MEDKRNKRKKVKDDNAIHTTDTGAVKPSTAPDNETTGISETINKIDNITVDIFNFLTNHIRETVSLHIDTVNNKIEINKTELDKIKTELADTKKIANDSKIKFETLIGWVKAFIGGLIAVIITMVGYYLTQISPKMNEMHTEIEKLKQQQQIYGNCNGYIESKKTPNIK